MTDTLALECEDSALLPGAFRLAITAPEDEQSSEQSFHGPFALIGRDAACSCTLDHPSVSRRHAYLQALFGRLYCLDLSSGEGTYWADGPRKGGWLDPEDRIRIGAYQIRLIDSLGLGSGGQRAPVDFNPLAKYPGLFGPLPIIEIEAVNGAPAGVGGVLRRLITLVGRSSRCKLRLDDPGVSSIHGSLVLAPDGLWIADLAGEGGVFVGPKRIRYGKIQDGQSFRIGRFVMRARYRGKTFSSATELRGADPGDFADAPEEPAPRTAKSGDDPRPRQEVANSHQQNLNTRLQQLESREAKFGEAQQRLASEWDRIHSDRTALTVRGDEVLQQHQENVRRTQELAEQAAKLHKTHKRLKTDWKRIHDARTKLIAARKQLAIDRADVMRLKEELQRQYPDAVSGDQPRAEEFDTVQLPGRDVPEVGDPLDSHLHNKVFRTERAGDALIVTPFGDASQFFYDDVHTEANRVRRLLEGSHFRHLVVDLTNVDQFGAVTMNVIVALARIVSNRGGRAALCCAMEKTRTALQGMKLLEMWPLLSDREAALRHVEGPDVP